MTPSEFKAWFEGFRSGIGERAPTAEEWKLVCEKAAGIVGAGLPVYPLAPIMPDPSLPTSPALPWPYGRPWWESPITCTIGSGSQPSPSMDGLMTWNGAPDLNEHGFS